MLKVKRILKSSLAMLLAVAVLFTAVIIFTNQTNQNKAEAADGDVTYVFKAAADWAKGKIGSSYAHPSNFICDALITKCNTYFSNKSFSNQNLSSDVSDDIIAVIKNNDYSGKYKVTSGFSDYDILVTSGGSMGFYIGGYVYYYSTGDKVVKKTEYQYYKPLGISYAIRWQQVESSTSGGGTVDSEDSFDAYIICPGASANNAGKALELHDEDYVYKNGSTDSKWRAKNVSGKSIDYTNTRQIWHFDCIADNTYLIYSYANQNGTLTKFYLNLQTSSSGNDTTPGYTDSPWIGENTQKYWNVIGWSDLDTANPGTRFQWQLNSYNGTDTDAATGSVENESASGLYYISSKAMNVLTSPNADQSIRHNIALEETAYVANTYANACMYDTGTYSSAFFIQKINSNVNSDVTVQITTFGDSGKSISLDSNGNSSGELTESSWDAEAMSKQAWIFEKVADTNPQLYTIKSEAKELSGASDKYLCATSATLSSDNTSAASQWLIVSHFYNESETSRKFQNVNECVVLIPKSSFGSGSNVTEACSSSSSRSGVMKVLTDSGGTANFNLQSSQFFTLTAVRRNFGNFVSPIKTAINSSYGLSILSEVDAASSRPNTGYGSDTANGRAIIIRQIAKQSTDSSASDCIAADEQWHFEVDPEKPGAYKIVNGALGAYEINGVKTQMMLTVSDKYFKEGTSETLEPYARQPEVGVETDKGNSSRWYIYRELTTDNEYSAYHSLLLYDNMTYALDVQGGSVAMLPTTDATKRMEIYPYSARPNRSFIIDPTNTARNDRNYAETSTEAFWAYIGTKTNESLYLKSPDQKTVNDTQAPSSGTGTGVDMTFTDPGSVAEKRTQEYTWKFEPNPDGSYVITACAVTSNYSGHEGDLLMFNRSGETHYDGSGNLSVNLHNQGTPGLDKYFYITPYDIKGADGKIKTYYTISVKDNGQMAYIGSDNTLDATFDTDSTIPDTYLFTIEKTDLSVSADMPNVEMHLFNYGVAINQADGAVLPFSNGSINAQTYVDSDNSISGNDIKPTMKSTLTSDGFPEVEKYYDSAHKDDWGERSGSLRYLFDPNMGSSTDGFVQGSGSADSYNPTSNSSYQSQHFTVNNPTSLFRQNPTNGLYYYDSILNAAYFQRDEDSSGKLLSSGNFKLFDYTIALPLADNGDASFDYKNKYTKNGVEYVYQTETGISPYAGNFFPFNKGHEQGTLSYGKLVTRPKVARHPDYTGEGIMNVGEYVPANYSYPKESAVDAWFGMTMTAEFEQSKGGKYEGKDVQFNFQGDDDVWVYMDDVLVLDIGGTHRSLKGSINFQSGKVVTEYLEGTTIKSTTQYLKDIYQAVINTNPKKADGTPMFEDDYMSNNFTGNTYTDGTKHTLKFFYLERGGAVSYCKLNFNLPKGEPVVTKKVENKTEESKDCYYKFQLTKSDGTYFDPNVVTYTVQDETGAYHNGLTIRDDGTFYLKDGQTAYFHGIDDDVSYKITEDKRAYDKTAIVDAEGNVTETLTEDDVGYDNNPATVDEQGNPTGYYQYTVNKNVFVKSTTAEYSYLNSSGATVTQDYTQGSTVTTVTDNPQHFTFTNTLGEAIRTISGYAWVVKETGGVLSERQYISDMTVQLYNKDGAMVAETVTNSDGYYSFGNVPAGECEVRFSKDKVSYDGTEYVFSDKLSVLTQGVETSTNWQSKEASQNLSSAYINSDNKLSYAYLTVDMPTGAAVAGIDELTTDQKLNNEWSKDNLTYKKLYRNAGFVIPTRTISGYAFVQKDDGTRVYIQDMDVTLYDASGNQVSGVTAKTDSSGYYTLKGVPAGVYEVRFKMSTITVDNTDYTFASQVSVLTPVEENTTWSTTDGPTKNLSSGNYTQNGSTVTLNYAYLSVEMPSNSAIAGSTELTQMQKRNSSLDVNTFTYTKLYRNVAFRVTSPKVTIDVSKTLRASNGDLLSERGGDIYNKYKDTSFSFKITYADGSIPSAEELKYVSVNSDGTLGTTEQTANNGVFTLTDGQTVRFLYMKPGVEYKVEETSNYGDIYKTEAQILISKTGYADASPYNNTYPAAELEDEFFANIALNNSGTLYNAYDNSGNVQLAERISITTASQTFKSQIWKFTRQPDGSFVICNVNTGKYLTVTNYINGNQGNLVTQDSSDSDTQRWFIYQKDNQSFFISAAYPNLAIDCYGRTAGGEVELWSYHGDWNQRFVIDKACGDDVANPGDDFYANIQCVRNGLNATVLDDNNAYVADPDSSDKGQQWHFIRQSDGSYIISNGKNRGCLDNANNTDNLSEYNSYVVKTQSNSPSQRWFIYTDGDSYYIRPANTVLKQMDQDTGSDNLGQWSNNDGKGVAQRKFNINKLDSTTVAKPSNKYAAVKGEVGTAMSVAFSNYVIPYTDELPSTGGTGKAIYFIIGAMLALPLLVFSGVRLRKRLSVKRRYSKQPYIRH